MWRTISSKVLNLRTRTTSLKGHPRSVKMISTAGRDVNVSVPRLPVPPLRQTLDAYLESLEPFLEDLSLQSGRAKEELVAERRTWAADFETGLGKVCQKRLLGMSLPGKPTQKSLIHSVIQTLKQTHLTTGWTIISGPKKRITKSDCPSSSTRIGGSPWSKIMRSKYQRRNLFMRARALLYPKYRGLPG
jgi:hypothetical protein